MAFCFIEQPKIIDVDEKLRLRKFDESEYAKAIPWYENPQVLLFSEGITDRVYDIEVLNRMYKYLGSIGEIYFIEVFEDGAWQAVGDVTLSDRNMPIVLGDEKYWGKGIGRRVIAALLQRAKNIGLEKIFIPAIYKYNDRSRNLFKSFGFVKIAENGKEESYEKKL